MRSPRILLLLLICLCLSACVPTMRTLRPELSGTVTDFISKEPLEGVLLADDPQGAETRSDAQGRYSLRGHYALGYTMLGGEGYNLIYSVRFSKAGYLPFTENHFGGFGTGQGMSKSEVNPRMLRENHPIAVAMAPALRKVRLPEKEAESVCLRLLAAVRAAGLERSDAEYLLWNYGVWFFEPLFGRSDEFCWRELKQGASIWP